VTTHRTLAAGAVALVALGLVGCSSSTSTTPPAGSPTTSKNPATSELVFFSVGGTFQKAQVDGLFQPCADKNGITLKQDEGPSVAKIRAAVESGNVPWDIIEVGESDLPTLIAEDLIVPIDYSYFDQATLDAIDPVFRPERAVEAVIFVEGIGYRTDVASHPTTWAEFWDTSKFPGLRVMPSGNYFNPTVFESALVADGVTPGQQYPIDFDRAFKSLDKIKGSVKAWHDTPAPGVQLLVDGEVNYGLLPNGRVLQAKGQGAKVDFDYSQAFRLVDYHVVPKGAKNLDNAMKCLAYSMTKDASVAFMKLIAYGRSNKDANKALQAEDPAYAATLPTSPDNYAKTLPTDMTWYAQDSGNGKTWLQVSIERWNEWYGQ